MQLKRIRNLIPFNEHTGHLIGYTKVLSRLICQLIQGIKIDITTKKSIKTKSICKQKFVQINHGYVSL